MKPFCPKSLMNDALMPQGRHRSIAIVTTDIKGPVKNGGVGTAYSILAEKLVQAGHDVTIFFANRYSSYDEHFHLYQRAYSEKGITLLSIPEPPLKLEGLAPAKVSFAAYLYLKDKPFDIIHFPDMHGVGYFSLLAKKSGTAFDKTVICVIMHGPSIWSKEANGQTFGHPDELQNFFLEMQSVALADLLVVPSHSIFDWAVKEGWKFPKRTFVQPLPSPQFSGSEPTKKKKPFNEIVFFGRVDRRKGLDVFLGALSRVPREILLRRQITFLGQIDSKTKSRVFATCKALNLEFRFLSDFDQGEALTYLKGGHSLAILSSLSESQGYTVMECITTGIPFLASDISPFKGLVHPAYHKTNLFTPVSEALAAKLTHALQEGVPLAKYAVSQKAIDRQWIDWHSRVRLPRNPSRLKKTGKPLVSVCIPTKDRPQFLERCLLSVEEQTYSNLEVVLIDDGSTSRAALAFLEYFEKKGLRQGWRCLKLKKTIGPAAARNKAAKIARGEFLFFLDDDNILEPTAISDVVHCAQIGGAPIVTSPFYRFSRWPHQESPVTPNSVWIPTGADLATGFFYNTFGDMNSLIRKDVFSELNGLRGDAQNVNEDWEFFARAVIAGQGIQVFPNPVVWQHQHQSNRHFQRAELSDLNLRLAPYEELLDRPDFRALLKSCVSTFELIKSFEKPCPIGGFVFNPKRTNLYEEDFHRPPIFDIYRRAEVSKLKNRKDLSILREDTLYHLKSKNGSPTVELSIEPRKGQRRYLLDVEVSSLQESKFRLSYLSRSGHTPRVSLVSPIRKGNNRMTFPILCSRGTQKIHISPFEGRGEILLQKLQLFEA